MAKYKKTKKNNSNRILGAGIILLLCGLLFLLFYFLGSSTEFSFESAAGRAKLKRLTAEIPLCEKMRCERWTAIRRRQVLEVSVYAKTDPQHKELLNKLVSRNRRKIQDDIRSVVAAANQWDVRDPQLKKITRNLKLSIGKVVGPELVKKILIPTWNVIDQT